MEMACPVFYSSGANTFFRDLRGLKYIDQGQNRVKGRKKSVPGAKQTIFLILCTFTMEKGS